MDEHTIITHIKNTIPDADINFGANDGVHYHAVIISAAFEGLSRVKRQQLVYTALTTFIEDGSLHAFSFKTQTPEEAKER